MSVIYVIALFVWYLFATNHFLVAISFPDFNDEI
ncbi:hypothetical protein JOD96_001769 [Flavobacterium sp. 1355]|nr:hypothetical protein [Flavobacterium sp. 1355]